MSTYLIRWGFRGMHGLPVQIEAKSEFDALNQARLRAIEAYEKRWPFPFECDYEVDFIAFEEYFDFREQVITFEAKPGGSNGFRS